MSSNFWKQLINIQTISNLFTPRVPFSEMTTSGENSCYLLPGYPFCGTAFGALLKSGVRTPPVLKFFFLAWMKKGGFY